MADNGTSSNPSAAHRTTGGLPITGVHDDQGWKVVLRERISTHNFSGADREAAIQATIAAAEEMNIGPALAHRFASENKFLNLDNGRTTDLRGYGVAAGWSHSRGMDVAFDPQGFKESMLHEFAHDLDTQGQNAKNFAFSDEFISAHNRDDFHVQVLHAAADSIDKKGRFNGTAFEAKYTELAKEYNHTVDNGLVLYKGRHFGDAANVPANSQDYLKSLPYNADAMSNAFTDGAQLGRDASSTFREAAKKGSYPLTGFADHPIYKDNSAIQNLQESFAQNFGRTNTPDRLSLMSKITPHTCAFYENVVDKTISQMNVDALAANPGYAQDPRVNFEVSKFMGQAAIKFPAGTSDIAVKYAMEQNGYIHDPTPFTSANYKITNSDGSVFVTPDFSDASENRLAGFISSHEYNSDQASKGRLNVPDPNVRRPFEHLTDSPPLETLNKTVSSAPLETFNKTANRTMTALAAVGVVEALDSGDGEKAALRASTLGVGLTANYAAGKLPLGSIGGKVLGPAAVVYGMATTYAEGRVDAKRDADMGRGWASYHAELTGEYRTAAVGASAVTGAGTGLAATWYTGWGAPAGTAIGTTVGVASGLLYDKKAMELAAVAMQDPAHQAKALQRQKELDVSVNGPQINEFMKTLPTNEQVADAQKYNEHHKTTADSINAFDQSMRTEVKDLQVRMDSGHNIDMSSIKEKWQGKLDKMQSVLTAKDSVPGPQCSANIDQMLEFTHGMRAKFEDQPVEGAGIKCPLDAAAIKQRHEMLGQLDAAEKKLYTMRDAMQTEASIANAKSKHLMQVQPDGTAVDAKTTTEKPQYLVVSDNKEKAYAPLIDPKSDAGKIVAAEKERQQKSAAPGINDVKPMQDVPVVPASVMPQQQKLAKDNLNDLVPKPEEPVKTDPTRIAPKRAAQAPVAPAATPEAPKADTSPKPDASLQAALDEAKKHTHKMKDKIVDPENSQHVATMENNVNTHNREHEYKPDKTNKPAVRAV